MTDFAVRIFITDHYLTKPLINIDSAYNEFTKAAIPQVPIIRVFGSTPKGQKVCAHIHGVYPYFYVPFFEDVSLILNEERLNKFLQNFASSLSSAINLSLDYQTKDNASHIFRVTLVKGKPFYGYQEHFQYFLKIYLYNPFHMKKAGDLLLSGAVMNRSMQPYETHIPYNLKFFIDYNLYGMNYLYTDGAMFRVNKNYFPEGSLIDLDISDSVDLSQKMWNIDQLPPDCMMDDKDCWKTSFCELEVDISACDILNIQEVQKNIGENPGLKDLWEDEKQRRIKLGLDLSDLVGEVYEERPIARSTESHVTLLEEWREVCASVKEDIDVSQEIAEFICASPSVVDDDEEEWDLDESVNEDSIKTALRTGDSFIIDAVDSNNDLGSEDDREMVEFVNACIKMEEEDSIMHEGQSDASSSATIEKFTQKCPSYSQHNSTVVNDPVNSDEDLFDQTFIDLSLDDSNDGLDDDLASDRDATKRTISSDDLFEDDSFDINSDYELSDTDIIKTHDGADDDDDDDLFKQKNKRQKLDTAPNKRTPIVTRSKNKLDSRGQPIKLPSYFPESQTRKKATVRKPRPSLKLKNSENLTNTSLICTMETNVGPIKTDNIGISNDVYEFEKEQLVKESCFVDLSKSIVGITSAFNIVKEKETVVDLTKSMVGIIPTVNNVEKEEETVVDLTKSATESFAIRKEVSKHRKRPSLSLKNCGNKSDGSAQNSLIQSTIIESQRNCSMKSRPSIQSMYSTPSRSKCAPLNDKFADISPIMKPSNTGFSRQRTVSFSIPEVSQESPDKSASKIQTSQKLEVLEFMKKTVSLSLQEMSNKVDYISQRFQASMMSHLTVMSVEVQCSSRSNLQPNPSIDPVLMFFYSVYHESDLPGGNMSSLSVYEEGVVFINDGGNLLTSTGIGQSCSYRTIEVSNEAELLNSVIDLVMKFDPDILVGYETTRSSWGYVLERSYHTKHKLYYNLGRLQNCENKMFKSKECSFNELHCSGRIILDLWIVMKHELTLTSYTLESVVDDVLKERVPLFTNQQLMALYRSNHERYRVVDYWKYRVLANLRLLTKLDVISRTSEFAKIYGIEFYHVLSRGSQYRVESMMLRLAKPQNLIALSPSVQQRARQKAPECIPLTLEPRSGFYKDPIVVLDFQSLYPSVMIAYNYCFSTSIGKLSHIKSVKIGDQFEFGCGKLNLEENTIKKIEDDVNISPNQVVFVKPNTYKGIISKMVEEILTTRIMVKKSMKIHKNNKGLCKLLDSRQLGLKLIANVTFGYTAAAYSGRMPCVEVGDSIMRKSRETLEEAIQLISSGGPDGCSLTDEQGGWAGCQVIYGDTDSMFVLMPGRTKEQAFTLGARMADAVTAKNPFPVKLKFEKVFLPCLLESKKRYVGYSYETLDQEKPKFDAKGIETVRRDNCNIVSRILERTLIRMFEYDPLDSIKRYVIQELDKVLSGKVNMIDFIIAKEYRGRNTYRPGASIPALHIANALRKKDVRSEPLNGERVPYVIIQGAPGDTLLSCVRQPRDLLFDTKLLKSYGNNIRSLSEQGCQLSYVYYITKQILPPLHRALSLLGVDVFKWYSQMPRRTNEVPCGRGQSTTTGTSAVNRTISWYFSSQKCSLCASVIKHGNTAVSGQLASVLCDRCLARGKAYIYGTTSQQLRDIEDLRVALVEQCHLCTGTTVDLRGVGPPCVSGDCPVLFDRISAFQRPTEHLERLLESNIF